MVNQQKIIPIGRLYGVIVDTEGASVMDDSNPYPALLGIDYAIDMNGFINLKKRTMSFERESLRVVVLLDLAEWARYVE